MQRSLIALRIASTTSHDNEVEGAALALDLAGTDLGGVHGADEIGTRQLEQAEVVPGHQHLGVALHGGAHLGAQVTDPHLASGGCPSLALLHHALGSGQELGSRGLVHGRCLDLSNAVKVEDGVRHDVSPICWSRATLATTKVTGSPRADFPESRSLYPQRHTHYAKRSRSGGRGRPA